MFILVPVLATAGVSTTKHNLSVSGPGPVKAVSETQVCIFCHTPHRGQPDTPLWNHLPSAVTNYTNYWSESMKAYDSKTKAPPIDGFSKLCLGCHDGTVAMGAVKSRKSEIQMRGVARPDPSGMSRGILGTDLSGGHPLSFVFDDSLRSRRNADPSLMDIKWPIDDRDVKLDKQSKFQCTSCHNAHENRAVDGWPPFWHKKTYGEVCDVCHESPGLSIGSKSARDTLKVNPLGSKSMQDSPHGDRTKLPGGCGSCHKGHGKNNTPMLPEQKNLFCFRCHGYDKDVEETRKKGDLTKETKALNLKREFEKPYHHPVEKTGIHRHGETLPETEAAKERHSECVDCHHQHYVTKNNKMAGIEGIDKQRSRIQNIESEYELCFRCHSSSANRPADQTDILEALNPSNPSYHPILAAGKETSVPSLIPPMNNSSTIKCSDCHNNDDPMGPRGPHGSKYKHILIKNFSDTDGLESPIQYELCYTCHRRSSILGDESFKYHSLHISRASCKTCHNSHGSKRYTHLIDFSSPFIRPSSGGRLEFVDMGLRAGECYLTCHGKDHNPGSYPFAIKDDKKDTNTIKKSTPSKKRI